MFFSFVPSHSPACPFAWKSDGVDESCQKGGAYQWSPQTDSFLRKQHTSYGSYLFICFVHVLFQTFNVHHQPPEWVPEIRKEKKKKKNTQKHKLNAHGETKLLSKTAQALHPSSKSIPHPHGSHSTFLPRILEICSSTKELDEGKDVFEFLSRLVKRTTRPSRVLRPHRQAGGGR